MTCACFFFFRDCVSVVLLGGKYTIRYSIHLPTVHCLTAEGSRHIPDVLLSSHVLQCLEGDPEALSVWVEYIIHSAFIGSDPVSPSSCTCLPSVPNTGSSTPDPSSRLLIVWAPEPVPEDEPRHQEGKPILGDYNLNFHCIPTGKVGHFALRLSSHINSPVWMCIPAVMSTTWVRKRQFNERKQTTYDMLNRKVCNARDGVCMTGILPSSPQKPIIYLFAATNQ